MSAARFTPVRPFRVGQADVCLTGSGVFHKIHRSRSTPEGYHETTSDLAPPARHAFNRTDSHPNRIERGVTPWPRTPEEALVEEAVVRTSGEAAVRLGMTRRHFLKTSGGMAAALLALNSVFGRFFEVFEAELFEPAAFAEQQGAPYFIFDVQTHYVSTGYDPSDSEARRRGR